jgi:hypothetical protein
VDQIIGDITGLLDEFSVRCVAPVLARDIEFASWYFENNSVNRRSILSDEDDVLTEKRNNSHSSRVGDKDTVDGLARGSQNSETFDPKKPEVGFHRVRNDLEARVLFQLTGLLMEESMAVVTFAMLITFAAATNPSNSG